MPRRARPTPSSLSPRPTCSASPAAWSSTSPCRLGVVPREKAATMTPALSAWSPPPQPLALGSDEVHVWRALLDVTAAQGEALAQTLAADEWTRTQRFRLQR